MPFHIVLVEPEIPQNAGNIVRTCAATGSMLHLVEPLGFSVEDRYLKRAGLDYWDFANVTREPTLAALMERYPNAPYFFATTKAQRHYAQISYPDDAFLVFGKETRGLPEALLYMHYDRCIRIPMLDQARSLNLSNAVAIVLYEALRQKDYLGMTAGGQLREYTL